MANSQDNGCLGCLFLALVLLAFVFPGLWVVVIIWRFIESISDESISEQNVDSPTSLTSPTTSPPPDDLANILNDLSNGEIKDPVTQEIFRPGEKVYLCHVHRLAYHQDSWQEMGCRCMVCGNNAHTKDYTLPQPISFQKIKDIELEFKFRDIE